MFLEGLLALCLLGAVVVFLAPNRFAPRLAFLWSLLPLALSLELFRRYDGEGNVLLADGRPAFENQIEWIALEPYTISWWVGVDGISMPLIVLATILTTLAIVSSWTPIDERQSQFYGLLLLMEAALIGVFVALDFFLWFIFWEAVLIPMYLLIGVWGGPRRKYAAIKFFIYTNVASLVMFIGFVALVFGLGDSVTSFGLPEITQALLADQLGDLGLIGADTLRLVALSPSLPVWRSRYPQSLSIPGFPTPTSKRRPRSRSSWLAYC